MVPLKPPPPLLMVYTPIQNAFAVKKILTSPTSTKIVLPREHTSQGTKDQMSDGEIVESGRPPSSTLAVKQPGAQGGCPVWHGGETQDGCGERCFPAGLT